MDDEPFEPDSDPDFDLDDEDDEQVAPTVLRATIARNGRVTVTRWRCGLAEGGPAGVHFRARERAGVAIADLHLMRLAGGRREVAVEFMAAGRARENAEAALTTWARNTGHACVWLPGGPVELDPPPAIATASVTCPTCRVRWMDSTINFWCEVRNLGHFPLICPTCGNNLPQWDVVEGDLTRCRGA